MQHPVVLEKNLGLKSRRTLESIRTLVFSNDLKFNSRGVFDLIYYKRTLGTPNVIDCGKLS